MKKTVSVLFLFACAALAVGFMQPTKGSISIMPPSSSVVPIQLTTLAGMTPDSVRVSAVFKGPDAASLSVSSPAWGTTMFGCPPMAHDSCVVTVAATLPGMNVNVQLQRTIGQWGTMTNVPPGGGPNNTGMNVTTYIAGPDTAIVTIMDTGIPVGSGAMQQH